MYLPPSSYPGPGLEEIQRTNTLHTFNPSRSIGPYFHIRIVFLGQLDVNRSNCSQEYSVGSRDCTLDMNVTLDTPGNELTRLCRQLLLLEEWGALIRFGTPRLFCSARAQRDQYPFSDGLCFRRRTSSAIATKILAIRDQICHHKDRKSLLALVAQSLLLAGAILMVGTPDEIVSKPDKDFMAVIEYMMKTSQDIRQGFENIWGHRFSQIHCRLPSRELLLSAWITHTHIYLWSDVYDLAERSRDAHAKMAIIRQVSRKALEKGFVLLAEYRTRVNESSIGQSIGSPKPKGCAGLLQFRPQYDFSWTTARNFKEAIIRLFHQPTALHPGCLVLSDFATNAVAGGGFGDVWKGIIRGREASVKAVKAHMKQDVESPFKALCREAIIRSQLKAITEVAQGLTYLHDLEPQIVHGDIKGVNILVTDDVRCCLADFGLSAMVESHTAGATTFSTIRWLAPELLMPSDPKFHNANKARDIYAFGCTMLEMFTGKPFCDLRIDASAIPESPSEPRPAKKKALLIGTNYRKGEGVLKGPHKDICAIKQLLIERYRYKPADIDILTDEEDAPIQSAHANIVEHIKLLVHDVKPGDRFFFHYAGHTDQVENRNHTEEDGLDECIVPTDNIKISDNDLRRYLVEPLPVGCNLVAVFEHHKCNRVHTPWMPKGRWKTDSVHDRVGRDGAITDGDLHGTVRIVYPSKETNSLLSLGLSVRRNSITLTADDLDGRSAPRVKANGRALLSPESPPFLEQVKRLCRNLSPLQYGHICVA